MGKGSGYEFADLLVDGLLNPHTDNTDFTDSHGRRKKEIRVFLFCPCNPRAKDFDYDDFRRILSLSFAHANSGSIISFELDSLRHGTYIHQLQP